MTLTAYPAACGDCLVLEYGAAAARHRILIDGGLNSAFEHGLGTLLPPAPAAPTKFDLVIVSHIDRDHIDGVIIGLRDQRLDADDFWFNGRDEIEALIDGDGRGVRQGDALSDLIPAEKRNRIVSGQAIHVPASGPVVHTLPGGATCTLLTPSPARLNRLYDIWPDTERDLGDPTDALLDALDAPAVVVREFGRDGSEANGSSIAFVFEFEDVKLLLTADAYAADLVESITTMLRPGEQKLAVDLFKLSHHGSRANMTDELLELIDPAAVLVCTDGSKFKHPDLDALDKVRHHYPNVPIHFTANTPLIQERAQRVGSTAPAALPVTLRF